MSEGYGTQPAINSLEPQFAELADSMADLEANMMHLQLMHESLSRFSESFASFLYGLNMNAFCVDFPEVGVFHRLRGWYVGKGDFLTRCRVGSNHRVIPQSKGSRVSF